MGTKRWTAALLLIVVTGAACRGATSGRIAVSPREAGAFTACGGYVRSRLGGTAKAGSARDAFYDGAGRTVTVTGAMGAQDLTDVPRSYAYSCTVHFVNGRWRLDRLVLPQ